MAKLRFGILLLCVFLVSMTVDKPAYQIFDVRGKKTSYQKMVKDISECEVVLFGEMHDNPISHWLELQLTKDLFKEKKQNLILGAEMLETDDQSIIDKYLKGEIVEDTFRKQAHLWKNYSTDYKPLVEFARNTNVKLVATNCPRKYATMVNQGGFEALNSLTADEKKLLAPLPIEYDPELVGNGSFNAELSYNAFEHICKNHPDITACVCANDYSALGVMKFIKQHSKNIGKDFALAGYGNYDISEYLELTSVDQKVELMIKQIFCLIEQYESSGSMPACNFKISTELKIRESCCKI